MWHGNHQEACKAEIEAQYKKAGTPADHENAQKREMRRHHPEPVPSANIVLHLKPLCSTVDLMTDMTFQEIEVAVESLKKPYGVTPDSSRSICSPHGSVYIQVAAKACHRDGLSHCMFMGGKAGHLLLPSHVGLKATCCWRLPAAKTKFAAEKLF